jgi:hypothetical protein
MRQNHFGEKPLRRFACHRIWHLAGTKPILGHHDDLFDHRQMQAAEITTFADRCEGAYFAFSLK